MTRRLTSSPAAAISFKFFGRPPKKQRQIYTGKARSKKSNLHSLFQRLSKIFGNTFKCFRNIAISYLWQEGICRIESDVRSQDEQYDQLYPILLPNDRAAPIHRRVRVRSTSRLAHKTLRFRNKF